MVFLDLEKAYDPTWRGGSFLKLLSVCLRGALPTFIRNLFSDRSFSVMFFIPYEGINCLGWGRRFRPMCLDPFPSLRLSFIRVSLLGVNARRSCSGGIRLYLYKLINKYVPSSFKFHAPYCQDTIISKKIVNKSE